MRTDKSNRVSRATREFIQQLRTFFATEGIATEACFDRWVFEATEPRRLRRYRKVTSIRQTLKGTRAQQQRAAR